MPVHNAAGYVGQSIESILAQTFPDFELVVLDNGSTDGSAEIAERWAARDARIRVLRHPERLGPVDSSNAAVRAARAPVIARMDADDVAHPDRLSRELAILDADPEVVLVGTLWEGMDARGRRVRPRDRSALLDRTVETPFPHGSALFPRSAFDRVGGYLPEYDGWEDLDLFQRLAQIGRVAVIPEALYLVRFHAGSITGNLSLATIERLRAQRAAVANQRFGDTARRSTRDTVYYYSAIRLWAGRSVPGIDASARQRGLALSLWLLWARLHPPTLRAALAAAIRFRDSLSGRRLPKGAVVEWRFG
jgi:glycosyltransferase involved in cell wall biosynthesis